MHYELFWIRRTDDSFESGMERIGPCEIPDYSVLCWSNIEFVQTTDASILVHSPSGSWIGIAPRCSSLGAIKRMMGTPSHLSQKIKAFLYRRNILSTLSGDSFYPSTIETQEGRNIPERYLFVVEPTERCNLRCVYCFKSANATGADMTLSMARRVVDYISLYKYPSITVEFSGGEPTLNLPAVEVIAHGLSKKAPQARFIMQTNSTRVDDELVRLVRRYKMGISTSLEGDQGQIRKMRLFADGKDASACIMNGMRKLRRSGILGGVVSVFNQALVNNAGEFLDVLQELGVSSVKCNTFVPLGRGRENARKMEVTDMRYGSYLERFVEEGMARSSPIRESNTFHLARRILGRMPSYRCGNSPCDAGYTFQTILPNGDIYPCSRYTTRPAMALGNIVEVLSSFGGRRGPHYSELASLLVSENSVTSALNLRTVRSIPACSKCNLRAYCGAGCGMQSFDKHGSFDKPSAQCGFFRRYIPRVFEWIIKSPRFRQVYFKETSRDSITFDCPSNIA